MTDNLRLREVGIGTAGSGISNTFPGIPERAGGCRFSDCRHEPEPGCAVRRGIFLIGSGALNPAAVVA
jgi:ribosome biogenesis GTPase